MEKTHWKKLENPDYLGSYALQPEEELVLTIKSVGKEEVYNPTSKGKEECTVAHFTEDVKPMILNVTNCKMIAKVWDSPYIEDWVGKKIQVHSAKVKAFGDVVEALRVMNVRPSTEVYKCVDCGKEIKAAAGKTPKQLADIAVRNCGRILCLDCMKKEAAKKEEANDAK